LKEYIRSNIEESISTKKKLLADESLLSVVEEVSRICIDAYEKGNKIMVCGNGGSASDAQHMAGGRGGGDKKERGGKTSNAFLNANTTVMTALGNDYDYKSIFAKQVAALGKKKTFYLLFRQAAIPKIRFLPAKRQKKWELLRWRLREKQGAR